MAVKEISAVKKASREKATREKVTPDRVRTKPTASESIDESSQEKGTEYKHRIRIDKSYNDEASDSGDSSSESESESDSSYDSTDEKHHGRKPYVYAVLALVSVMLLAGRV